MRSLTRIVFLFFLLLIIAGCNRDVSTIAVIVEGAAGDVVPVEVEDLGRRRSEEEAVVVPLARDGERPFRFRITPQDDRAAMVALPGSQEEPALSLRLAGAVQGGAMVVHGRDSSLRFAFDRIIENPPDAPIRIVAPLGDAATGPWEVEFEAPPGSSGFTIQELRFHAAPVRVHRDQQTGEWTFHARIPLALSNSQVQLRDTAALIRDHTDGIFLGYHADSSLFQDRRNRSEGVFILSDQQIPFRLRPGESQTVLRPRRHSSGADSSLSIRLPEGVDFRFVEAVRIPSDPRDPVLIDLEELQNWPRELWRHRDFGLFAWSDYPQILWMDHRTYDTQSEMFTRLAFFVEKRGFQGRLLSDEELADKHGWNAHNYRPEGLIDFFNTAEATNFALNESERELREIVAHNGLIIRDETRPAGERWLLGTGGVLSISQDSFSALRRLLTVHEALHGVFYMEPVFRDVAFDHWNTTFSPRERNFWQQFFAWMTYDPDDQYLMVNEFQAYILQQSEASANWYFGTRIAGRLRNALPSEAEPINQFLRDYPNTFITAAEVLNRTLFEEAGMVGGDPFGLVLPR